MYTCTCTVVNITNSTYSTVPAHSDQYYYTSTCMYYISETVQYSTVLELVFTVQCTLLQVHYNRVLLLLFANF